MLSASLVAGVSRTGHETSDVWAAAVARASSRKAQRSSAAGASPPPGADAFFSAGEANPAAVAHRPQDQEIADRLRHPDTGGKSVRVLPARRMLDAVLP